jgi:hypothetical protein
MPQLDRAETPSPQFTFPSIANGDSDPTSTRINNGRTRATSMEDTPRGGFNETLSVRQAVIIITSRLAFDEYLQLFPAESPGVL